MAVPETGERCGAEPPGHQLVVPVSDEQLREQCSAFVAGGLAAGEQVSYVDDGTADAVLERLTDDGVDTAEPLRTGQLRILPPGVTRSALAGRPEELAGILDGAVDAALDGGWRGLRFTGDLVHGLERPGGVLLPDVDGAVDRVVRARPARALCVYDRARFPAWLVDRMRALHSGEIPNDAVYDDGLLRITRGRGGVARLAGEIDHSNRQQVRRVLEPMRTETLRSSSGPVDLVLDLVSLRFVDVATAVSVVHAAEELPSSHRLVLTGVRPRLARTLERCGATAASQLDVRTARRA
ncbi:MAG: MEDS domain-containing protein [Actinomycetota bacterium]|nr:MEDS domain-containing protein [Actinomycetota bacterium]